MYHKKHSDIVFCDTYIDWIRIVFLFSLQDKDQGNARIYQVLSMLTV